MWAEEISMVFQYWSNFKASSRSGAGNVSAEHTHSTKGEGSHPVPNFLSGKNWGVLNLGGGGFGT